MDYVGRYGMGRTLLSLGNDASPETRKSQEDEADRLLKKCLSKAEGSIKQHRNVFDEIVADLLENEEIDEEGVRQYAERIRIAEKAASNIEQN